MPRRHTGIAYITHKHLLPQLPVSFMHHSNHQSLQNSVLAGAVIVRICYQLGNLVAFRPEGLRGGVYTPLRFKPLCGLYPGKYGTFRSQLALCQVHIGAEIWFPATFVSVAIVYHYHTVPGYKSGITPPQRHTRPWLVQC